MEHTTDDFLAAARQIVVEAGAETRRTLHHSRVLRQKAYGDLVTDGDLLVEERVISFLRERFPGHGFESEEREPENPQAEHVWVLDPIDGTKYYARGVPLYSVSLALKHRGELVMGVVYWPGPDRLYSAAQGAGATLTQGSGATFERRPIRCSNQDRLEEASICLEIPSRHSSREDRQQAMQRMAALIESAYRVRILGVASVGLCLTADAGFDAYLNLGAVWKECDNAAGQVIVREAGGEFTIDGTQIVAGPASLCRKIWETIGI